MSSKRPLLVQLPEERERHRHAHYKNTTFAWKDDLRKRCLEELRLQRTKNTHQRSKNVEEKENTVVHDVMMKEWEKMQAENSTLQSVSLSPKYSNSTVNLCMKTFSEDDFDSSDDCDVEYVLTIVEELTQELILEEQRILAMHEQNVKLSEEALCAAIECLATSDVICPICQKDVLHQNKHIIFCSCGVRLDTAQDGVTLSYIQKQLQDCCSYHSNFCCGKPVFSLEDTLGIHNIIMNCTVCDHMDIII